MHAWADVAVLAKTKNLKGRFVAYAAAGLPFLLEDGDEVAFVPPQLDVPRKAVVSYVNLLDDHTAEIEFDGVDGDAASVLAGSHCLIPRNVIDESVYEEAPVTWEGWTVVDVSADQIGVVAGLLDNPGQALLEVEREDGSTTLVPVVDEIIRGVDVEDRTVLVDLPNGLLDL
ncbi:MAG: 16S rRNA processing protein RimM [Eggerthellaceae bacterium]|nr:16S rRNA processing protein RimM [Eggerthellaceae bacterium]